jgi:hypothetical protein
VTSTPSPARSAGLGLAAGVAGTIALTLAERAEMALTGREASDLPGQVGAKLTGHDPASDPSAVERLDAPAHWAHGIGLGAVRGLLGATRLAPRTATLAFFPLAWASDAALYRVLGLAPAPWRWSRGELGADLFGKGVLSFATSGAYLLLRKVV